MTPYLPPDPHQPPFRKSGPGWLWPLLVLVILACVILWANQTHFGGVGVVAILIVAVPIAFVVLIVRALLRVGDKRPPPVIVQQPTVSGPPPGWYVDPAGLTRWYDGQRWTEHVKPEE